MKTKNVKAFLKVAEDLEEKYPFLYVEIARTRPTDYMAFLKEKPKDEKYIAKGQGSTADEACADALSVLNCWNGGDNSTCDCPDCGSSLVSM